MTGAGDIFQSTRPIRGATSAAARRSSPMRHFNPRAPYGARPSTTNETTWAALFQSTRPIRGATRRYDLPAGTQLYFNPRAPYGARQYMAVKADNDVLFQSTRPIRGATLDLRPLRVAACISIHAPHTGRDRSCSRSATPHPYFNPRAPYGARRFFQRWQGQHGFISIHAPHTGRDGGKSTAQSYYLDFNPRAPYGARLMILFGMSVLRQFQSTRPIRGATAGKYDCFNPDVISIHAPHTGRDLWLIAQKAKIIDFNPRAPYGARLLPSFHGVLCPDFNPRAPYGARPIGQSLFEQHTHFNPRAPYGARP